VAGIPWKSILTDVISDGALRLDSLIMVIIFGSALAELVKRSGIVEVMIRNTAEFLGDRLVLISVFLMLIIALLSTVLSGLGAVVMIGTVVFPIMISLGISKLLAASIFLMGLSIGGMLNLVNWALYIDVLHLSQGDIFAFVIRYIPVALLIAIAFIWIETRREAPSSFKLRLPPKTVAPSLPVLTYFTPIIPVVIIFIASLAKLLLPAAQDGGVGFDFPILGAMFIGIVYGTLTAPKSCGPRVQLLIRSLFEGITHVRAAIVLMIGIGMLLKSVSHPMVKELLTPLMRDVVPGHGWTFILFFTLAAPLSLYRGPLNIWGMGSGLVAIIKDVGILGGAPIMAAIQSVGQLQGVSDPTNSYNVWIANYLGVDVVKIMKKTLLPMWLIAMAGLFIAGAMYFR
jgi:hypothetical protein